MYSNKNNFTGQVIFEFIQMGAQTRVAAIDADTGTEVIIVAPSKGSQEQMKTIALAKLKRRLQKDADAQKDAGAKYTRI